MLHRRKHLRSSETCKDHRAAEPLLSTQAMASRGNAPSIPAILLASLGYCLAHECYKKLHLLSTWEVRSDSQPQLTEPTRRIHQDGHEGGRKEGWGRLPWESSLIQLISPKSSIILFFLFICNQTLSRTARWSCEAIRVARYPIKAEAQ